MLGIVFHAQGVQSLSFLRTPDWPLLSHIKVRSRHREAMRTSMVAVMNVSPVQCGASDIGLWSPQGEERATLKVPSLPDVTKNASPSSEPQPGLDWNSLFSSEVIYPRVRTSGKLSTILFWAALSEPSRVK